MKQTYMNSEDKSASMSKCQHLRGFLEDRLPQPVEDEAQWLEQDNLDDEEGEE